jgi:4-amino-4-deoxy-L-arabinose transferase-like glycosyltransferase
MLKNRSLLVSLFIYTIGFVCLRPWYQYLLSPDGVGYLAVTKHLANGDFVSGINGYWSPLHSWLAIPFYKAGFNEFAVFIAINGLCGAGILIVLNSLLRKTTLRSGLQSAALFISIPILLSYAFVFDVDILLCLLLQPDRTKRFL